MTRQEKSNASGLTESVEILAGTVLHADLHVPGNARGIVLFAHGSGSSRLSPRNRFVAQILQRAGFATVLLDLLSESEEAIDARTAELRFDIDFLARRLVYATRWIARQPELNSLKLGYFGASTGAAAALVAAADAGQVTAIVSRGGRPDLAGASLQRVSAPVLLLVGEMDHVVMELNRQAMARLACEKHLEIIPAATHLFEEPGALDQVAEKAVAWFDRWLGHALS
jgi:putative phosphoribosyl transferase